MLSWKRTCIVIIVGIILFASFAIGDITEKINYQGRLLDSAGDPVPDGPYLIQFRIYDDSVGGTTLWDSGYRGIIVTNGLFSYILGDSATISTNLFRAGADSWLGIRIGTDPEISPRALLTSGPYSHHAILADVAGDASNLAGQGPNYYLDWVNLKNVPTGFIDGVDDVGVDKTTADKRYINENADTITGILNLFQDDGDRGLQLIPQDGEIFGWRADDRPNWWLGGITNAQMHLYDGVTSTKVLVWLATSPGDGGILQLLDTSGAFNIVMKGGVTGDQSVELPADAINDLETLNEPGFAFKHTPAGIALTKSTLTPNQVDILEITTPTTGYIHLEATSNIWFESSTSPIRCWLRINESAGGAWDNNSSWSSVLSAPTGPIYEVNTCHRIYFKPAGTYTFILEGAQNGGDVASRVVVFEDWMKATFYPTAYGAVVSTVPTLPQDNPDVKTVAVIDPDGNVRTAYQVDLRYYELRAKEAKIAALEAAREAEQAQREFEEARAREQQ